MIKKIKKSIEFTLFLIVMLQVFLLFNMVFAHSYIIYQTDSFIENSKIIKKEKEEFNLINSGINLLIGFLSIKQIGIVSAEDVEEWCCKDTCDLISSANPGDCEEIIQTNCEETEECKEGCCYDPIEGLCTEGSPFRDCTEDGGDWYDDESCSMSECQNGCCILPTGPRFITEEQCEKSIGDFKQIWNELDCLFLSATQFEGACIKDGQCTFTTEEFCLSWGGQPYPGYLCSYPELNTGCDATEYTGCVSGKDEIYWFDSCGNKENIYSSDKEDSWNNGKVLSKELSCDYGNGNINSEICGNCVRPLSKCSETELGETNIKDGDFICKDLGCQDAPANVGTQDRISGERWCLYDSYIGDGKDTVGSEHWEAYCYEGEVKIKHCDNLYRGEICQEQITEENEKTFSMASCVTNQASSCLTYNPLQKVDDDELVNNDEEIQDCKDNKHCMIKNIDVDDYFEFDMCVPRYSKGADLTNGMDDNICSMASRTCTIYYKKKLTLGGIKWVCEENCNCEDYEFAEQMNDLCISLGDCGSYINYLGEGTENVVIVGKKGVKLDSDGEETDKKSKDEADAPDIYSWTNYKSNKNPVSGQYIEPQDIDDFAAQFIGSGGDYEATNYTEVFLWMGGLPGAAALAAIGISYVSNVFTGTTGVFTYASTNVGLAATVFGGVATALASIAIGMIAATFLANALGISGPEAITMIIAGGVAGAGVAAILLSAGGANAWNIGGWIALAIGAAIVAFIALTGIGTMETRIVEFSCMPWQAQTFTNFNTAQSNCEKCNEDPLRPCTKYRCESLGQTCKILNEDEENPACNSIAYEPNPPIISPGETMTENYQFYDEQTKSVEIISTERSDGCIEEFTSVYFTLGTDEPAQCKYSFELPPATYEDMIQQYPFEQNAFTENHTFEIWMPSLDSLEVYDVSGDLIEMSGNVNMYVRCKDYWENSNIDSYIVKFCINSGSDETAVNHALTTTNPKNGATLEYGTTETDFEMWINELADCKYDTLPGKDYDDMINEMVCSHSIYRPSVFGWPCSTKLENLIDGENKFYIKCKDKPWADTDSEIEEYGERNINVDDYEYTLDVSSSELKIDSISFNTIVSDRTINILSGETFSVGGVLFISVDMEVKTSGGISNGKSSCEWGVFEDGSKSLMSPYYSLTNTHTQLLTPRFAGTHINYIECKDEAGNIANSIGEFTVTIDSDHPEVVRTYYDAGKLNLITDEIAQCYYDFDICGFNINDETIKFDSVGYSTEHKTDWITGETYNIKCVDVWGNINPSGCDIRIIPSS